MTKDELEEKLEEKKDLIGRLQNELRRKNETIKEQRTTIRELSCLIGELRSNLVNKDAELTIRKNFGQQGQNAEVAQEAESDF